jgi:transposase
LARATLHRAIQRGQRVAEVSTTPLKQLQRRRIIGHLTDACRLDEVAGSSQYELTVVAVAQVVPRSRAHEKEPAMEHCAIDLGGRKSQVCIRASDGSIVHESRQDTLELAEFLRGRPQSRVVIETCAEAFAVADAARSTGHEVRVVSATLVKSLGVGARRTKTDRRDAQALSQVSCQIDLPSVHVPSAGSREVKSICGMRDVLVSARTQLINNVRGWLRGRGYRIRSGVSETFSRRVREIESLPQYVEAQLRALDTLSLEIKEAEKDITRRAEDDETCRRLMTVPGVGPQVALRFVATADEIARFRDAHRLESYLGLVPGEKSSSDKQQRLSITKAGSTAMRWLLIQAAWVVRNRCRSLDARPLQLWALEVEKRRGRRIAIVALARKIAGILYALWRDETTYAIRR